MPESRTLDVGTGVVTDTIIASYRTCNHSELKNKAVIPGSMILCKDSGDMYADTIEGERVRISKQVIFITEEERKTMLTPEEERLYITTDSFLCWYYKAGWHCISLQVRAITNDEIDAIIAKVVAEKNAESTS